MRSPWTPDRHHAEHPDRFHVDGYLKPKLSDLTAEGPVAEPAGTAVSRSEDSRAQSSSIWRRSQIAAVTSRAIVPEVRSGPSFLSTRWVECGGSRGWLYSDVRQQLSPTGVLFSATKSLRLGGKPVNVCRTGAGVRSTFVSSVRRTAIAGPGTAILQPANTPSRSRCHGSCFGPGRAGAKGMGNGL